MTRATAPTCPTTPAPSSAIPSTTTRHHPRPQRRPRGHHLRRRLRWRPPQRPRPRYECRFIQSFYSNTDQVAVTTGMCVLPIPDAGAAAARTSTWSGWCRTSTMAPPSRPATAPTLPAVLHARLHLARDLRGSLPREGGKPNYNCFVGKKEIREQHCGLEVISSGADNDCRAAFGPPFFVWKREKE